MRKLLTFFSAKNFRILYIESAKIVNEMALNELVKLTTLLNNWALLLTVPPNKLSKGSDRMANSVELGQSSLIWS